jgi:Na+/melibiose symporter-like transporter
VSSPSLPRPARLPTRSLVAYSLMTLPLACAGLPIALYLAPIYTDRVGLDLAGVGLALMAARIVNVGVDMLVGWLSDRDGVAGLRRKPWIALGTPVMMLASWKLFMPPAEASLAYLFAWALAFYVGWSLITVPYGAWGAELSDDYHERSRIVGYREGMSVLGLLMAVTAPVLVSGGLRGDRIAAMTADVQAFTWLTLALLPITAAALCLCVRERPAAKAAVRARGAALFSNKPFLVLLAAGVVSALGTGINQTTTLAFYTYRARLAETADVMIFVFFVAALAGAPFWVWLGARLGKHRALAAAAVWNALFLAVMPFIPAGNVAAYTCLQLATGLAYAGPLILGASMAADVIDLDWLKGGAQRGALFIAVWGVGQKLSEAVGVGIALPALKALGFSPEHALTADAQNALVLVSVIAPMVLALCSVPLIWLYPIDARAQRRISAIIARRTGRDPAVAGANPF